MSWKSGSSASEAAPSQLGRKLLDLTFAEFLDLLKKKGRSDKAAKLEELALKRLVPPLTKQQVLEATVEVVALSAEIVSLLSQSQPMSGTVRSRMKELEEEGFSMLPGGKHG